MKFFIDAHLPFRLVAFLRSKGIDAKHTDDMPRRDRTRRVVVTKDSDFLDSHLLGHQPRQLLLVSTGNITNKMLISLFEVNLEKIFWRNLNIMICLS